MKLLPDKLEKPKRLVLEPFDKIVLLLLFLLPFWFGVIRGIQYGEDRTLFIFSIPLTIYFGMFLSRYLEINKGGRKNEK